MFPVMIVYGFHFLIRVLVSQNFGDSDGYEALILDNLKFGYTSNGGPLYTWMLHFIVSFLGLNIVSFLIFKYAAIFSIYYFYYLIYLTFSPSKKWAILSSLSLGSCYFIIWRLHEVMTQRLLTTSVSMLIVYYYFSCARSNIRYINSIILGVFFGLGLLTEIYILIVISSLLIMSLFKCGNWSGKKIALSLIVGLLISMPYYSWLFFANQFWQYFAGGSQSVLYEHSYLLALRAALLHPLYVISPAIFLFGALLFSSKNYQYKHEVFLLSDIFLIRYVVVCCCLWVSFFGLLFPSRNNEVQAALPVFLPVLILVFVKLESRIIKLGKIIIILCILPVVSIFFRVGNLLIYEPFCRNCRWGIPYEGLAESLSDCVKKYDKLIIYSSNVDVLSNLKRFHAKTIYKHFENLEPVNSFGLNDHYLFIEDASGDANLDMELKRNQLLVAVGWKQPYLNFSTSYIRTSRWRISYSPNFDSSCFRSSEMPF